MNLEKFRREAKDFVEASCPTSMRRGVVHFEDIFEIYETPDAKSWRDAMASRGWTAPTWPAEYGGGGLSHEFSQALAAEMAAIRAVPPEFGPGIVLVGPTLLEFGTETQRQRHIPKIVSGEFRWCQGYSEPGAGSDLASLQCKAVLEGDHFVINGQKIWTSGAHHADWMFALVRTDPDVPKHEGISFVLLDMHQPGVTVRPIRLISGSSPFCETFFTDAVARRDDLVGELNKGWGVSKKLLQFERAASSEQRDENPYSIIARQYLGGSGNRVSNSEVRDKITRQTMLEKSLDLTVARVMEESSSGNAPGAAASIFKLVGSIIRKEASSLKSELRGVNGTGWEGDEFSDEEIKSTREWLRDRAVTIYGGTDEIQMNIIAKRVLGLPD
jgi:alkylation response protein AidB-like acyl-CoA dehydrogenase